VNSESHITTYRVDEFVQDAINLKVTPFMLDMYSHEYEDLVRNRDAHLVEMDELRNTNRRLSAHVYVPSLIHHSILSLNGIPRYGSSGKS
jgi:hypothetical protein